MGFEGPRRVRRSVAEKSREVRHRGISLVSKDLYENWFERTAI